MAFTMAWHVMSRALNTNISIVADRDSLPIAICLRRPREAPRHAPFMSINGVNGTKPGASPGLLFAWLLELQQLYVLRVDK